MRSIFERARRLLIRARFFQRVNLRAPQLKRDTGDRGAPQKQ
nr:MAG TPA: hypothetical protein [Caudoviricetes sp.]